MSLKQRVKKLEVGPRRAEIVFSTQDHLTAEEREAIAQEHRRANGLPSETVVIVFDAVEARL